MGATGIPAPFLRWMSGKDMHPMERKTPARRPFLRSLLCDTAANTIAISAAAMIPLMAMVGGGIDAGRYYMTAARMQAACDAGALAARRAMVDDNFTTQHRTIGLNFFDQNFNDGIFGSEQRVRDYTSNGQGVVTGTASAKLPTTIMAAFGYNNFDLAVSCSAEINISNTDIVFVLDVTGSMNCPDNNIAGCTNGNNNNTEASNSLIVGLRDAVMSFYDTVESATSAAAQVRYGLVPYANSVNVGFDIPRQYMADNHTYQSRAPDTIVTEGWVNSRVTSTARTGTRGTRSNGGRNTTDFRGVTSFSDCQNLANQQHWDVYRTHNPDNMTQTSQTVNGNTRTTVYSGNISWKYLRTIRGGTYYNSTNTCSLSYDEEWYNATGTVTVTEDYESTSTFAWNYRPVDYDVTSVYGTSRQMTAPVGSNGSAKTITWRGCIEEAQTVNTGAWNPTPAGAFDLNINLIPTTEAQKWKPQLNAMVWQRFNSETTNNNRYFDVRSQAYKTTSDLTHWSMSRSSVDLCVQPARKLSEIARSELNSYVNGLKAVGGTYHDIGMIWGARYISPRGIFKSENEAAPNGDAIARHIVFMTDGQLAPNATIYSTYGLEPWDRRVTEGDVVVDGNQIVLADGKDRHEARFQAACRAARQENITVWVVAFGTELTQSLTNCASPGRAYQANNNAALTTAFQEIAQKIAALRLTQ
jgi:Flp pilus assembly protein TadG